MKIIIKVRRKIKKMLLLFNETNEEKKIRIDYEYLINHGIDTEPGFVTLLGLPLIEKHPSSKIKIHKGVVLVSDSKYNVAGINHPVILSTLAKDAFIELREGCGLSGSSIICVKKIEIGKYTMLGVNTNVYDTDFHALNAENRRNQESIEEANSEPILIGNDVWIGANSTVLKGVVIGNGSVVGAHSLVNKSIGDNEFHAGVPARLIKIIN